MVWTYLGRLLVQYHRTARVDLDGLRGGQRRSSSRHSVSMGNSMVPGLRVWGSGGAKVCGRRIRKQCDLPVSVQQAKKHKQSTRAYIPTPDDGLVASPSSRWGLGSQQPISSQAAMRAREGLARSVQLVSLYKPRSPIRPRRASSGTIFAQSGDRTRREKGGWGTWPGGTSQCASWLVALGYVAASVPRWDDFPIPACARDSALVLLLLTPAATCDSDSRRGWVFRRIMSSDLHPRSVPLHIHSPDTPYLPGSRYLTGLCMLSLKRLLYEGLTRHLRLKWYSTGCDHSMDD